MRGAGGRAQYVSCSASARVVRDGGSSAVEDPPRHRRVVARRSARGVRCVGSCQWDVRAPALRSPASTGARGKRHAFASIAKGDSNLFSRTFVSSLYSSLCFPRLRAYVTPFAHLALSSSLRLSRRYLASGRSRFSRISSFTSNEFLLCSKESRSRARPIRRRAVTPR